jgi:hypothetical protein
VRPGATLLTSSFPPATSIADLVGSHIVMAAVCIHHDPEHEHTCALCLRDHVLYLWTLVGPEREGTAHEDRPVAGGFFITDPLNFHTKSRLVPYHLVIVVERDDDGDVAAGIDDTTLIPLRSVIENKWAIQALGAPTTPAQAQEEAEGIDQLRIHMAALLSGQDDVPDEFKVDVASFQTDPTYVLVPPSLSVRLEAVIDAFAKGSLSHLDRVRQLEGRSLEEKRDLIVSVTQLAAFFSSNILSTVSEEWWREMFVTGVEEALAEGSLTRSSEANVRQHPSQRDEPDLPPIDADDPFWNEIRGLL